MHCKRLNITPHVLVGDLDSIPENLVTEFENAGTEVNRFPQRKDFTDLELALIYAQNKGCLEILILGALGNRWDQTLANLLLPAKSDFSNIQIKLVDGAQEIQLLRAGEILTLYGKPGDTVSLVPLLGDADMIHTRGLEYPLNAENLVFGSTRGISNVLLGTTATVSLGAGLLVIVMIHF